MTDSGKAVFLSYASQDAIAAQHLCDALRAAGVEVWFDQSALRGGDAWDASIRKQIKSCALFIPVISRTTHDRDEGYFRLEWKLAVDRCHLMAADRAFLLPVVIDETRDDDERVPERFRELQWTRLPAGANTDAFVQHVQQLLSLATMVPASTARQSPSIPAWSASIPSSVAPRAIPLESRSFVPWVVGAVLVVATGYFVADKFLVSKHAAPAAQTPAAISGRADAVNDKSIAVLPFADMSEKKDQEYFSDGLAEELIEQLGKTPGLKVIARTSAFSFKGKPDDIPTIASKLKVANVLEGSVRRSGTHLRVSTQLIRAESGQPLWSETFDREFTDVFKVQDEIASAVVSALQLTLAGGETAAGAHGTTNPEAYSAFLLGRELLTKSTDESGYRQTIEAYRKAISLDAHYSDAYAGLALAQYYLGDMRGELAPKQSAEQTAQKAIDIDPNRALGYATRAYLKYTFRYNWVGAESDFQRASILDPTSVRVMSRYAGMLTFVGRQEEAEALIHKAIAHDPIDAGIWGSLCEVLVVSRKYSAAFDACHRALAIRPADSNLSFQLARLQLLDGMGPEALSTYQSNSFAAYRDTGVAMAEHTLGDAKASQQALDALIAKYSAEGAYQIAQVYAWRGENDKAFEWLERAYRQQDLGLIELKVDPLIASLRPDARYVALLRKLNFPP